MRTSGRDIYVTAGDNFFFTVVIKDENGQKIDAISGTDSSEMNIKINNVVHKIVGNIVSGEFSFYVGSDITKKAHGKYYYEVKHFQKTDNSSEDSITTVIPKSLFVIEESLSAE